MLADVFPAMHFSPAELEWVTSSGHHLAEQIRTLSTSLAVADFSAGHDAEQGRITLAECVREARQLGAMGGRSFAFAQKR